MIYRKARIVDATDIFLLNQKFYLAYKNGDAEKGFLKNQFSLLEIESLIIANEVVVAEYENSIIGYYLTNSIFETETIKKRKEVVDELIRIGILKEAKYVFLTQAVVDSAYMGKGIARTLLQTLKKTIRNKFDYLIGYIDAENLNAREAHLKSGWIIFAEMGNGYLAMTSVLEK